MNINRSNLFLICCALALALGSCQECTDTTVTEMLFSANENALLSDSNIDYRERGGSITCVNSVFESIAASFSAAELVAQTSAAAGNATYGNYLAMAVVVHSEAAYLALVDGGCLDSLDPSIQLDFSTQTLVVTSAQSTTGCNEAATVTLQEDALEWVHLFVELTYTPNDACSFGWGEAIIIDQTKADANFTLIARCSDNDDGTL